MKTNKLILTFIFVLANLLTFSQLQVLSTGNVNMGGGHTSNVAKLNLYAVDNCAIYGKVSHSFGWGDAIKSQVDRTDAIAFSAYYNDTRNFMVFGNGDIWVRGVNITGSDSILKYDIKKVDSATNLLKKLQGVTYKKKVERNDKAGNHIGLIAQDVEKVIPDIVYTDEHGEKGIAYEEIIPLLIEAIKEQQIQNEELRNQIEDCCNKNDNLKSASIATSKTDNLSENTAQLDQNIPNPFSKETRIGCFIPDVATTSVLYIYNMNGAQLKQYNLTGKGKQSVTINGNSFQPGMYLYALVIDGKEVDTKRMILTK